MRNSRPDLETVIKAGVSQLLSGELDRDIDRILF